MFDFLVNPTGASSNILSGNICDPSSSLFFVLQIAYTVIRIIQIAVPFALIIWGSIDFFKSVVAGDEKEMKQKRKPFIQRLIAALVIFLIPIIVNLIIGTFFGDTTFGNCYDQVRNNRNIVIPNANSIK